MHFVTTFTVISVLQVTFSISIFFHSCKHWILITLANFRERFESINLLTQVASLYCSHICWCEVGLWKPVAVRWMGHALNLSFFIFSVGIWKFNYSETLPVLTLCYITNLIWWGSSKCCSLLNLKESFMVLCEWTMGCGGCVWQHVTWSYEIWWECC
jgi:hypothetical protein